MLLVLSLDSASHLLRWSNIVYVAGAVLTLSSAALVLYEKRSKSQGVSLRWSFKTEILVIVAAFVSLIGTIGAIHFGSVVSHLKDTDLAKYKTTADAGIAQANKDAAVANAIAQQAKSQAEETSKANLQLQIKLAKHEEHEQVGDAKLAAQNKENYDFSHALAFQQQTMAQQMHVSPELNESQIEAIAAILKPFAGQEIIIHRTSDTVVGRLGRSLAIAFTMANIKFPHYSIDMDQIYQGVSVVIHSPQNVPPLANALISGLRSAGIIVNPVALDTVPVGKVALYLGPN